MAFVSISDITGHTGRKGNKPANAADVVVAVDKASKKGEPTRFSLRVSISPDIAKKARLIAGDRVTILFDRDAPTPQALLKRVASGGWMLSASSKHVVKGGVASRLTARFTWTVGLPSLAEPEQCDAVVTDEGVLFDIPASASFTKNMRLVGP